MTTAQDCLDRSWVPLYMYRNDHIGTNGTRSLAEYTDYLNEHLPGVPFPLQSGTYLRRRGQYNNFREVDWQELLGGRSYSDILEQALSIAKSAEAFEQAERRTDPWVRRSYDMDSFIARVTILAVHRQGFRLAYRPPYLKIIT
ncbi:hypothetical protein OEA41_004213 [Lepraria neglecta]|uniref:Uncharacterized protein n=1 Tax=Lepraria neglecta TaxID=209136 RepID=A0AAE0DMM5_9LECA|nr:hypothetical protein OEA41_004214 [Lepraria neglecta]KAK3175477.1 hypothetical protein OEA41_004213 [Lepraria neglecta]